MDDFEREQERRRLERQREQQAAIERAQGGEQQREPEAEAPASSPAVGYSHAWVSRHHWGSLEASLLAALRRDFPRNTAAVLVLLFLVTRRRVAGDGAGLVDVSQAAIARELGMHRQHVGRTIARLIDAGYLRQLPAGLRVLGVPPVTRTYDKV